MDPLLRRIVALESEVRRLSANQGSPGLEGAMRRGQQYLLDSARLQMQLRAVREGSTTSGQGGDYSLDEALRAADQDIARYGY